MNTTLLSPPYFVRVLRTFLLVSLMASLSVGCATTEPAATGGTTKDGGSTTDGGPGTDSGTTTGTDTITAGTDSGTAGVDTGNGGGGGPMTGTVMTVKEAIQKAQAGNMKTATCTPFVNPPELTKIVIKGLVAVTNPYTADKKKTLDGIMAQSKGGGAYSGLRLMASKAQNLFAGISKGDSFDIEAQAVVFYCTVQFKVMKVKKLTAAAVLPVAATVTLADVGEKGTPEKNNSYESAFVTFKNVVVGKKGAPGSDKKQRGDFWLGNKAGEEGLVVATDFNFKTTFYKYESKTKTWTTTLADGDKLKSISGVLSFSFGKWKLTPLSDAMLVWDK